MPLTGRAKALMGMEATAALLTSLLVVARAVGALGIGWVAATTSSARPDLRRARQSRASEPRGPRPWQGAAAGQLQLGRPGRRQVAVLTATMRLTGATRCHRP